ncbi:MAG: hypothetical protein IPK16_28465 [Anaerolineales bacterium]|nr:hypothetical protein [Anaerolineales bacterium]
MNWKRVAERTAQLAAAMQGLERSATMKDEFMAAVSHELRTTGPALLGMAEALEMQFVGPSTNARRTTCRTFGGAVSGSSIVSSILRYTGTLGAGVHVYLARLPVGRDLRGGNSCRARMQNSRADDRTDCRAR